MVASIRDIGNIAFCTSAFQTSASNIASEFNIDMADGSTVNNIIYSDGGENDKMRGRPLTPSVNKSRSISPSIESDSGDESYLTMTSVMNLDPWSWIKAQLLY